MSRSGMSGMTPRSSGGAKTPGWRIGSVAGTPVYLAPSWLLIAAALTLLFLAPVRNAAPDLGLPAAIAAAATFPVLLLASVLAHELAHGAAARGLGLPVHEYALTFWGGHTSFGDQLRSPGASALIAAAGPAANLVLAGAGWAVLQAGLSGLAAVIVSALVYANGVVAVFNLLPGNPLDGRRSMEALLWRVTGNRRTGAIGAGWVGRVLAVAIVVVIIGLPLVQDRAITPFTAIWAVLIAGTVWSGATQSIRIGKARQGAAGFSLAGVIRPAVVVDSRTLLPHLPQPRWGAGSGDVVIVGPGGLPIALLDGEALAQVPQHAYPQTPVTAVARALPAEAILTAVHGPDALAGVARGLAVSPVLVVVSEHGILGTVDRAALRTVLGTGGHQQR
mgnify:FL=1